MPLKGYHVRRVLLNMSYSTSEDSNIQPCYVRHKCTANCKEIEIELRKKKIDKVVN